MWPDPTASSRGWRISADRLPILVAVFCGAALIVCLLCALFVYRCCIMPRKDKHFCFRQTDGNTSGTQVPPVISPAYPNQTAVYAEPKNHSRWDYNSRILTSAPRSINPWFNKVFEGVSCVDYPGLCPVPRSSSHPGPSSQASVGGDTKRQRPMSQPLQLGPSTIISGEIVPKSTMPEISEFSPQTVQYGSSSNEVNITDDFNTQEPTFKTRSLPAWIRSRPRPLSTEDDLNDLYEKVNFSKKRKNRMRNDEAAIIALSKSRSQYLHKDTDSLVHNEAVIVYDERTAL